MKVSLIIQEPAEDLLEEIEWCDEKINNAVQEFEKQNWMNIKRFYELLIKIQKSGIRIDEPLIREADALFQKRMMLKISAHTSNAMVEASVLMLVRLIESKN